MLLVDWKLPRFIQEGGVLKLQVKVDVSTLVQETEEDLAQYFIPNYGVFFIYAVVTLHPHLEAAQKADITSLWHKDNVDGK